MLKLNLLLMFMISIIVHGNCQTDIDRLKIHKSVVKILKKEQEEFYIHSFAKRNSFSNFDFAGGGRGLDTNSNSVWNNSEWISFVKSVHTSSVSEYALNIGTVNRGEKKELIFAPIIFSNDETKALSIAKLYSSASKSGSGIAWFFHRQNKGWKLSGMQIFSFIN